jgi:hypothetical protein
MIRNLTFLFCSVFSLVTKSNIVKQPTNSSACATDKAVFTFLDTFKSPKTYTWQKKQNNVWVNLSNGSLYSGVSKDTLFISSVPDSLNGFLYRARIEDNTGKFHYTDSALLTVNIRLVAPSVIIGDTSVCLSKKNNLTVSGGSLGTGAKWVWFQSTCGSASIANGATYNMPTSTPGTYTYLVRAEGICNNTACVSITVMVRDTSRPPVSLSGTATICVGKNAILSFTGGSLGHSASWQWYSGSCGGKTEGTGTTKTVSPAVSTTFFLRAEGACNNTICRNIVVTVLDSSVPAASIAGTTTICSGQGTTLSVNGGSTGTGAIWSWYTSTCGGTPVGTGTSISVKPAATTTYFVRAEGTCNTSICRSVTVTVRDSSVSANLLIGTTTICLGKNTTLGFTGGSLGHSATWQWYSGSCGGKPEGAGTTKIVSPAVSTTYFLRAEGTCNNTVCRSITVTVQDTSVPVSFITGTSEICYNANSTLSISGGKLGQSADWKWYSGSCGSNLIGSGSSVVVSPGKTGAYNYFVRAEGLCNTTICKTFTLQVRDSSVVPASISGTTPICRGRNTTLTLNGGKLATNAIWNWYSGACGGLLVGSGTSITVAPQTTTSYFVRAEGICNTTSCASVSVVVRDTSLPASFISFTPSTVICRGRTVVLNVIGGTLGSGAVWRWYSGSCGGGSMPSGQSITVNPNVTTTYFVRAESSCNTTICRSITITVQDTSVPAVSINGSDTLCQGRNQQLSVTGGSLGTGAAWKWYRDNCEGQLIGTGTSITIAPDKTGNYFVRAEGFCNNTLCQTKEIAVLDSSRPAVYIDGNNEICLGQQISLTALGGKLGSGASWRWYLNGCGNTGVAMGENVILKPTATVTYFVRAEGKCNASACKTISIRVNPLPKLLVTNDTVCAGEIAQLSVTGAAIYKWYPGVGFNDEVANKPSVTLKNKVSSPTLFRYIAVGTDLNKCTDSTQATILLNPLPSVDAGANISICPGSLAKLRATGAKSYTWQPVSGLLSPDKDTTTAIPVSTTWFKVIGTDLNNCKNQDSVKITVFPRPIANAGKDDSVCSGKALILNGSGGVTYNWFGSEPLSQTNIAKPIATPKVNTKYILRIIDANGCIDFDTVKIDVIANPVPVILGRDLVCKNEHGTSFSTSKTINTFHWSIQKGSINGGQGTNSVIAQWSDKDSIGKISVTEALKYYPFCSTTANKIVNIKGTISPTPAQLVLKADKIETEILICPNCNFEKYQWGYESKITRTEVLTCKDIIWCKFPSIDTLNNFYWVKIGPDLNCQTKSYFNAPVMLSSSRIGKSGEVLVYPNPAEDMVNIKSNNPIESVQILNGVGAMVEALKADEMQRQKEISINTGHLKAGIYFVRVLDFSGVNTQKLIIQR